MPCVLQLPDYCLRVYAMCLVNMTFINNNNRGFCLYVLAAVLLKYACMSFVTCSWQLALLRINGIYIVHGPDSYCSIICYESTQSRLIGYYMAGHI